MSSRPSQERILNIVFHLPQNYTFVHYAEQVLVLRGSTASVVMEESSWPCRGS